MIREKGGGILKVDDWRERETEEINVRNQKRRLRVTIKLSLEKIKRT